MSEDSDLKDQAPTQKRIDDMREKGQTLRSRDLSGGVILLSAITVIMLLSNYIKSRIEQNFVDMFSMIAMGSNEMEFLLKAFKKVAMANFLMLMQIVWILFFVVFPAGAF